MFLFIHEDIIKIDFSISEKFNIGTRMVLLYFISYFTLHFLGHGEQTPHMRGAQ